MATVTETDAAGAADWLSVLPQQWPPTGPVLMTAIVPLRQDTAAGYLGVVAPGTVFWASARDAPNLLSGSQAIIGPPGASAAPEPPLTVNQSPGLGAGTSNATR
jgi:hypothetical protein